MVQSCRFNKVEFQVDNMEVVKVVSSSKPIGKPGLSMV